MYQSTLSYNVSLWKTVTMYNTSAKPPRLCSQKPFWHVTVGKAQMWRTKWMMAEFHSDASAWGYWYSSCWLTVILSWIKRIFNVEWKGSLDFMYVHSCCLVLLQPCYGACGRHYDLKMITPELPLGWDSWTGTPRWSSVFADGVVKLSSLFLQGGLRIPPLNLGKLVNTSKEIRKYCHHIDLGYTFGRVLLGVSYEAQ